MKRELRTASRLNELKFKGYSRVLEETKGWYVGNIVLLYPPTYEECGECLCTTCNIQEQYGSHRQHIVDPDSICQFTGIQDRYGQDIYEGDILLGEWESGEKTLDVVGWNNEEACFGIMSSYAWRDKEAGKPRYFLHSDFSHLLLKEPNRKRMSVIGNVYSDKDLLLKDYEA